MYSLSKKIFTPTAFLLSYLLFEPVVYNATLICQDPHDPILTITCGLMPAIEFTSPTEPTQFRQIKDLLHGPAFIGRILIGNFWIEIHATRTFNNISQLGLALVANIPPGEPTNFEVSHVFHHAPCRFIGSAMEKGTPFRHVASLSFRPADPDAIHVNATGPNPPNSVSSAKKTPGKVPVATPQSSPRSVNIGTKLFYISALVTLLGLAIRFATLIKEIDVGAALEGHLEACFAKFFENLFTFVAKLESGIARGLDSTLPRNYQWVAHWVIRGLVVFCFLCKQYGLPPSPHSDAEK